MDVTADYRGRREKIKNWKIPGSYPVVDMKVMAMPIIFGLLEIVQKKLRRDGVN